MRIIVPRMSADVGSELPLPSGSKTELSTELLKLRRQPQNVLYKELAKKKELSRFAFFLVTVRYCP